MNAKAQDSYSRHHAEALGLIEQLRQQIEDLPAPDDDTHWGHVGNLAHLVLQLRAIADQDQD
jgi:hypothetical protein